MHCDRRRKDLATGRDHQGASGSTGDGRADRRASSRPPTLCPCFVRQKSPKTRSNGTSHLEFAHLSCLGQSERVIRSSEEMIFLESNHPQHGRIWVTPEGCRPRAIWLLRRARSVYTLQLRRNQAMKVHAFSRRCLRVAYRSRQVMACARCCPHRSLSVGVVYP
jgi:hypothetical protein